MNKAHKALTLDDIKRLTAGHHNCYRSECPCECGVAYDKNWNDIISYLGRHHPACICKPEKEKANAKTS